MLRRKPTLVEVRLEDKEELEKAREARMRAAAAAILNLVAPPTSPVSNPGAAAALLAQFDSKPSIVTRIGFNISNNQEVEVKLKLSDAAAYQEVAGLLAPFRLATHLHENVFFDGSEGELSGARAVLRLRFYDGKSLLKGQWLN